jgi:hypothetical protein
MFRLAGVSASPRPLVISGAALASPPVPVDVGVPVPSRRNHVSRVKLWTPRAAALPKVTYWLVPLSWSAVPALADGVALAAADAGERPPAASTAMTAYW